jgi:hypothetical protein
MNIKGKAVGVVKKTLLENKHMSYEGPVYHDRDEPVRRPVRQRIEEVRSHPHFFRWFLGAVLVLILASYIAYNSSSAVKVAVDKETAALCAKDPAAPICEKLGLGKPAVKPAN